ncbi:MAG: hypothetical protein QXX41_12965 [Nitrososphaerota archaeon]
MVITALVNVLNFHHPHVQSIFNEGLWGFPEDKLGINKRKWALLEVGGEVLLYGEYKGVKGIWFLCKIIDKFESRSPVNYWIKNPTGYPWQVKLRAVSPYEKLDLELLDKIKPLRREELVPLFGVRIFKAKTDRWSLILFGDERRYYVSYDYRIFERMKEELNIRNTGIIVDKPDHEKIKEIIYQVGLIQNRFPQKEYPLENKRLDVVWKRTPKSVPSVVFEIQLGGNLFESLSKLKHAFDLWNSIPVLVTDDNQIAEVRKWIEGSFHELKDIFRIISWKEIKEYYEEKRRIKELETKLKLV